MILIENTNTNDPYFNLAMEEFLVRNLECGEEDYLLLYVNEPSIVLGKNQSIYKEVNFEYLRNGQLKLARRITGGGTVYHDGGNLNFSIISTFTESKVNNYRYFNQRIVGALGSAGVVTEMDTRNNIICLGKKISGSAQFTNRKNIISHGTLLLNADLQTLRACLKPNPFSVESKAVSSVNSSVMNLREVTSKFPSVYEFSSYLSEALGADKIYEFSQADLTEIEALRNEKFKTFEWIYGRSPATVIEKAGTRIEVADGLITSVKSDVETPDLSGVKYEYEEIKKALEKFPGASLLLKRIY